MVKGLNLKNKKVSKLLKRVSKLKMLRVKAVITKEVAPIETLKNLLMIMPIRKC